MKNALHASKHFVIIKRSIGGSGKMGTCFKKSSSHLIVVASKYHLNLIKKNTKRKTIEKNKNTIATLSDETNLGLIW